MADLMKEILPSKNFWNYKYEQETCNNTRYFCADPIFRELTCSSCAYQCYSRKRMEDHLKLKHNLHVSTLLQDVTEESESIDSEAETESAATSEEDTKDTPSPSILSPTELMQVKEGSIASTDDKEMTTESVNSSASEEEFHGFSEVVPDQEMLSSIEAALGVGQELEIPSKSTEAQDKSAPDQEIEKQPLGNQRPSFICQIETNDPEKVPDASLIIAGGSSSLSTDLGYICANPILGEYVCQSCGYTTFQKSVMMKHIQKKHSSNIQQAKKKATKPSEDAPMHIAEEESVKECQANTVIHSLDDAAIDLGIPRPLSPMPILIQDQADKIPKHRRVSFSEAVGCQEFSNSESPSEMRKKRANSRQSLNNNLDNDDDAYRRKYRPCPRRFKKPASIYDGTPILEQLNLCSNQLKN